MEFRQTYSKLSTYHFDAICSIYCFFLLENRFPKLIVIIIIRIQFLLSNTVIGHDFGFRTKAHLTNNTGIPRSV